MRKMMMLLLAAPIMACGPIDNVDPDGGDNPGSFTATLSMSITEGVPPGDFLVNGDTVCTNVTSCEHKIHAAGTYEITNQVVNSLCVPKSAQADANGDLVLLDVPCGLAPGYPEPQMYTDEGDHEFEFYTQIRDGQIIMHGFLQNVDAVVDGNEFVMDRTAPTGEREVFQGMISNDLCQITYHASRYDASGNLTIENDHINISANPDC